MAGKNNITMPINIFFSRDDIHKMVFCGKLHILGDFYISEVAIIDIAKKIFRFG